MFFFFKQKTAYEMRISDWSSDVCSSDLVELDGALCASRTNAQPRPRSIDAGRETRSIDLPSLMPSPIGDDRDHASDQSGVEQQILVEIGQEHALCHRPARGEAAIIVVGRPEQAREKEDVQQDCRRKTEDVESGAPGKTPAACFHAADEQDQRRRNERPDREDCHQDRKITRMNSSHQCEYRILSSASK